MGSSEDTFARLVSLAVHDLRTPLATMSGFARTLERSDLGEPTNRYVEMMVTAGTQLADLLDWLGLVARIEAGRWEPNIQDVDTLELTRAAAEQLDEADAGGTGAIVSVDREAATTALHQLARCALRHGGLARVSLDADGTAVVVSPIVPAVAPIVLGEEARDLGALVGRRIVDALGGSLELEGDRLAVRFA